MRRKKVGIHTILASKRCNLVSRNLRPASSAHHDVCGCLAELGKTQTHHESPQCQCRENCVVHVQPLQLCELDERLGQCGELVVVHAEQLQLCELDARFGQCGELVV